jgi:hexosaminidase
MRRRMAQGAPKIIPGLRRWLPGTGSYTFRPGARMVQRDERLAGTAAVLAADLRALTGIAMRRVLVEAPRPGDIVLGIGTVPGGAEGYRLTVGPVLTVDGNTDTGVFLGTRTILQLLRQGSTVAAGVAEDWPAYPERGLMLDVGRKYLPIPFLCRQIRELAYLKLNHLHLHLSDNLGFRLASDTHPEITSARHYTKAEIRELVGYAARYHVEVVPEIDFPGHMGAILAGRPELSLAGRPGCVDLAEPAAHDLMRDLLTEFLPLFPGRYWHIGADEYVAGHADHFTAFVNWADEIVRAAGKTTRMWNDGLRPGGTTITVSPDIVVEHWSAGGRTPWAGPAFTPRQLIAAGHRVHNAAFTPTYYTTGGPAGWFNLPPALMYDAWHPGRFVDCSTVDGAAHLGSAVHVWCDDPSASEAELATAIQPRLRVMAQQTWGSPKPAPCYLLFRPLIEAAGPAPA